MQARTCAECNLRYALGGAEMCHICVIYMDVGPERVSGKKQQGKSAETWRRRRKNRRETQQHSGGDLHKVFPLLLPALSSVATRLIRSPPLREQCPTFNQRAATQRPFD